MHRQSVPLLQRYAWIVFLLLLITVPSHAAARELAVDRDELVVVELATIGLNPSTRTPVVLLQEPDSGDFLPIAIGLPEAEAIMRALQGVSGQRPQTHDLIGHVLDALGASLHRVIVDELDDGVYMGAVELTVPGQDTTILVDSRPSDALALAATAGVPILVAPHILLKGEAEGHDGMAGDQVVTAIGITVVEATADLRRALDLPAVVGVLVSGVIGPAARHGLEAGDLILFINGTRPESPMDFLQLVQATPEGELVRILYWKDGVEQTMDLGTGVPVDIDQSQPSIQL